MELPDSLGGLNHLRYLDLSYTAVRRLPDSMGKLCNLQTLMLHNCHELTELPTNMRKLINLRHLDIRGTELKETPMHMSRLKNLQTLNTFIVSEHNGSTIKELRELNDLHGGLDILNIEKVINARDAQACNLKDKVHIEELLLQWSIETEDSHSARDVLDKLQPQTKLIKLTIKHYGGTRFPDWLGDHSFSNMVFLYLINCKYCLTLPPVGKLPHLRELLIKGFDEVVRAGPELYRKDSSAVKPFGLLEKLTFKDMPELEEWFCPPDEGVEFVCLRELCIENCPKLKGLLPDDLPCLTRLTLAKCDKLLMFGDNDDYSWPCLKELMISNMPDLKELPPGLMQNFSTIENLHIWSCTSFQSLPFSDLLTTLKVLYIHECPKLDLLLPETSNEIQMGHYCDSFLQNLTILMSCNTLRSFPLGLFPKLSYLHLSGCKNLESLWIREGVNLTALRDLDISSCHKFESFPSGGLPAANLTRFWVQGCKSLKSLPEGMHNLLPSLQDLMVGDCANFKAGWIEWGLQRLPNLKSFSIYKT